MALDGIPSLRYSAFKRCPGDYHHTRHYPRSKRVSEVYNKRLCEENYMDIFKAALKAAPAEPHADNAAAAGQAMLQRAYLHSLGVQRDSHASTSSVMIVRAQFDHDRDGDYDSDEHGHIPVYNKGYEDNFNPKSGAEASDDGDSDGEVFRDMEDDIYPQGTVPLPSPTCSANLTLFYQYVDERNSDSNHGDIPTEQILDTMLALIPGAKVPHMVSGNKLHCALESAGLAIADSEQKWECQLDREVRAHQVYKLLLERVRIGLISRSMFRRHPTAPGNTRFFSRKFFLSSSWTAIPATSRTLIFTH